MSDREAWITFAAASYAAWLAGGDYAAEECRTRAVADADWFVIESKKRGAVNAADPTTAELLETLRQIATADPDDVTWWQFRDIAEAALAKAGVSHV